MLEPSALALPGASVIELIEGDGHLVPQPKERVS
jgi:hypothetical protein